VAAGQEVETLSSIPGSTGAGPTVPVFVFLWVLWNFLFQTAVRCKALYRWMLLRAWPRHRLF
jgi:hypothetical protein